MTNAAQEQWISGAVGRRVDWDNGSYDCVDVAKDYGQAIFGVGWRTLWPGAGNANMMIDTFNPAYFDRIDNDPSNTDQIPQRADIIIYAGNAANTAGHIAVVLAADTSGVLMIDQDSNEQRPMAVERLAYDNQYTGPCSGWLRPKVSAISAQSSNITPITTQEDDLTPQQIDDLFGALSRIDARTGELAAATGKQYWGDLINAVDRINGNAAALVARPASDIAADLNAAGIAKSVLAELVKILDTASKPAS